MVVSSYYDNSIKITFSFHGEKLDAVAENLRVLPIIHEAIFAALGVEAEVVSKQNTYSVKMSILPNSYNLKESMAYLYLCLAWTFESGNNLKYTFNDLFPDYATSSGDKDFIPRNRSR